MKSALTLSSYFCALCGLCFCTLCGILFSGPLLSPAAAEDPPVVVKDHARYQRMGGSKGLNDIVDETMHLTAEDQEIGSFFAATFADPVRLKTFKIRFVDQICEMVGGPCHQMGKTMADAHAGMQIKSKHFRAFIENLKKAMDKYQIDPKDQKYLLRQLRPLKREIVNAPAKAKPTMGAGGFK